MNADAQDALSPEKQDAYVWLLESALGPAARGASGSPRIGEALQLLAAAERGSPLAPGAVRFGSSGRLVDAFVIREYVAGLPGRLHELWEAPYSDVMPSVVAGAIARAAADGRMGQFHRCHDLGEFADVVVWWSDAVRNLRAGGGEHGVPTIKYRDLQYLPLELARVLIERGGPAAQNIGSRLPVDDRATAAAAVESTINNALALASSAHALLSGAGAAAAERSRWDAWRFGVSDLTLCLFETPAAILCDYAACIPESTDAIGAGLRAGGVLARARVAEAAARRAEQAVSSLAGSAALSIGRRNRRTEIFQYGVGHGGMTQRVAAAFMQRR